jgi:hypothetical protein
VTTSTLGRLLAGGPVPTTVWLCNSPARHQTPIDAPRDLVCLTGKVIDSYCRAGGNALLPAGLGRLTSSGRQIRLATYRVLPAAVGRRTGRIDLLLAGLKEAGLTRRQAETQHQVAPAFFPRVVTLLAPAGVLVLASHARWTSTAELLDPAGDLTTAARAAGLSLLQRSVVAHSALTDGQLLIDGQPHATHTGVPISLPAPTDLLIYTRRGNGAEPGRLR